MFCGHIARLLEDPQGAPFSMTYGPEVVIPTEIVFPTLRSDQLLSSNNEQLLSLDLDLAEE